MSDVIGVGTDKIWEILAEVPDPEIPAVSVVDLGIVRAVEETSDGVVVKITPTYSGCPATNVISLDIENALRARGVVKLRVERQLSPPWTTDWISETARKKLADYGIAPPAGGAKRKNLRGRLSGNLVDVHCPRCGAHECRRVSEFGSTPCKAQYVCDACKEPFDYFKCI
jgi:ring-1,2-phenylacetyl-CoA epoxidase subunit PaaD